MSAKNKYEKMVPGMVKYINRYAEEVLHEPAAELQRKAEKIYERMYAETPSIGGGENPMAGNLYEYITFCAYYEASEHRLGAESVATIGKWMTDDQRAVGKFIDLNRKGSVRLLDRAARIAIRAFSKKISAGKWGSTWKLEYNPQGHREGISMVLRGCPLLAFARAHGYEEMLPAFCATDHVTAGLMHAKLIRFETEASGGSCCDAWYVGDRSETAKKYADLPVI